MDVLHDGRRLPMDEVQEGQPEMTMVEVEYLKWAGERIAKLERVVEAAREVDFTTGAGLAKLKEALEALDTESEE
jgi:hypothetical protein